MRVHLHPQEAVRTSTVYKPARPVLLLPPRAAPQAGEIESETAAILEMEDIRGREGGGWEPEVLACLPPLPWSIAPEELAKRRDFRRVGRSGGRGASRQGLAGITLGIAHTTRRDRVGLVAFRPPS